MFSTINNAKSNIYSKIHIHTNTHSKIHKFTKIHAFENMEPDNYLTPCELILILSGSLKNSFSTLIQNNKIIFWGHRDITLFYRSFCLIKNLKRLCQQLNAHLMFYHHRKLLLSNSCMYIRSTFLELIVRSK